ncbi:MAG TPA: glutamate--cysteine ligase [Aquabacterium sp.]|uniref:glutamate--cysteine ligase n=1 Tax=Aquabacterium sp. TaxID=1872578 RepID=UPI002E31BDC8|nr:glutamate--cysteine ligase [Aquabacterium sp.]HEX5356420.1 glutamate--cysteine ligase [Aquabacterium sp.]
MTSLHERLRALPPESLAGIRRGIEKESLRTTPSGQLALTPHPPALGSALTNPHITTDFSESQVEVVTGAHKSVQDCLQELTRIHQFVYRAIGDELLWASSMPCVLPPDDDIPIGQYGSSNVGKAKSVYRMGLSHRYGRRMQTISGIHYNWSMPGLSNEDYFGLIRNFRRQSFLLLVLFGASPAVNADFVKGQPHGLQPLGEHTLYLPHATSLRMGRLGYQSDAQSSLAVSYNGLKGYAASLQNALTHAYPPYEALGIQDVDGAYRQLSTSLLQIENEFYSTIRPKRVIHTGERPLHALRERGVEYVEVRCMDLNPFLPVGIDEDTARFLDMFLLHCLLSDSPLDTPQEIAALVRNQQIVAARGREPGLRIDKDAQQIPLTQWAQTILAECEPIAQALDALQGGDSHQRICQAANAALLDPSLLPSARVVTALQGAPGDGHAGFTNARSAQIRETLMATALPAETLARFKEQAQASLTEQATIEAADKQSFEDFRKDYMSERHLVV